MVEYLGVRMGRELQGYSIRIEFTSLDLCCLSYMA